MKRRAFSLLLSLTLLLSLALPATTAYAEDGSSNKGMEISKTVTANQDGSYTITLEAYATGEKVISEITKDVPTDIILVLDQSGSMAEDIGTVSFEQYKDESDWWEGTTYHTRNQDYYEYRHNGGSGNLWHKLDVDSYVSVSVTKQEQMEYKQLGNLINYEIRYSSLTENCYYYYANNLYEKIGDVYSKVELVRSGNWRNGYVYTYTFSDGTTVTSKGNGTTPQLGSHAPLFAGTADDAQTIYTYTYTDSNNNVQTIGSSKGAEAVFHPMLYQRVIGSGGGSKLNALKSAVTSFVNNVNQKALGADGRYGTADDVAHRIAIVGFASNSRNENTEFLSTERATDYWSANAANYRDALVSACGTNGGVNSRLTTAIDRLDASGDTYLEYGMDMANKIFAQYPITAEDASGRQRVVVVFTDGYPAPSGTDDFKYSMANNAIQKANVSKQTYGATVYTVGVFNTADPTADIETNFATSDGWYDSWGGSGNNLTEQQEAVAANRYMHYVSSNFPGATSLNQGGSMNPNANPFAGGGSYYLSAADAGSLNNIFKQISDQIETGGSSSTLTSDAVVKDIISPQFTLPEGANVSSITLETYRCTGKNGSDYTWSKNTDAMGAKASISGDQVNVTGFNFSENYVGTVTENGSISYRGHKLVISFKVRPKAGFLGGNDVITNARAGIYENGSAQTPVVTFEQPKVNVPIKDVTVTAEDKNVYLLGGVTADQLKNGATVKVGDVTLDLSKADDAEKPYGLDPWQNEYVNIEVKIKDAKGNVISDKLDNLKEDTTYIVKATVAPKTHSSTGSAGTAATAKTGQNPPANINVFKPELTFKDSQIDLGGTANYEKQNHGTNFEVWKHGETVADSATMIGTKPTLVLSYDKGPAAFTQDTPVKVTVKIGDTDVTGHTTFVHGDCTFEGCKWGKNGFSDCHFIVHVKSFDLTIKKEGWEEIDENQSFVFKVTKDDDPAFSMDVVIQGNSSVTIKDLKPGTYTVTEETGWSWRYTPNANGKKVEPKNAENGVVTVTFDNERKNDKWLNGGAWCKNLWGTSTPIKSN